MAKNEAININIQFEKEYKEFIEHYLLRLLGIVDATLSNERVKYKDEAFIVQEEDAIFFTVSGWRLFKLIRKNVSWLAHDQIQLANRIIQEFLPLTEYKRTGSGKQNNAYPDKAKHPGQYKVYRDSVCKKAIEKGICAWIAGDSSDDIEYFFAILEEWAVKTYEGKNVTLGFIINPYEESDLDGKYGNWLSFMKEDSVAVLTDCIHSVIELDNKCNFLRYISISESKHFPSTTISSRIPLRFTQIIKEYVVNKKVGVFLLNNGDFLLAKDQKTCFVKRNLRWLNLSYEAFSNSLILFREQYEIKDDCLIESIFSSILDVSFSHSGGIISVVGTCWDECDHVLLTDSDILHSCDNLLCAKSNDEIFEMEKNKISGINKEKKIEDLQKRMVKRTIIQNLVQGQRFQDLDRKLRSELMSLDGACILDCEGNIYSFGAIIKNDSGSSEGGRGAAASKLSRYGMAAKISTDGYIELYVNGIVEYAIK